MRIGSGHSLPGLGRDGGSVGGREITAPEPEAPLVVGALGEVARKSEFPGMVSMSGRRMPSFGSLRMGKVSSTVSGSAMTVVSGTSSTTMALGAQQASAQVTAAENMGLAGMSEGEIRISPGCCKGEGGGLEIEVAMWRQSGEAGACRSNRRSS